MSKFDVNKHSPIPEWFQTKNIQLCPFSILYLNYKDAIKPDKDNIFFFHVAFNNHTDLGL